MKKIKSIIKKTVCLAVIATFALSMTSFVYAANTKTVAAITPKVAASEVPENSIDIIYNENLITNYYDGMRCFIDSAGRTQGPVRTIAEALGFKVNWDGKTQTVSIPLTNDEKGAKVWLQLYTNILHTPNEDVVMDTMAVTVNGRTYIPVRYIAEALGFKVEWKAVKDNSGNYKGTATHLVIITKDGNVSASTGTETSNIIGVKTDVKLDSDLKSYWDTLDQSNFTMKNEYRVYYKTSTGIVKVAKQSTSIEILLQGWDSTTQDIVKNVLKNVCENPQEVFDKLNSIYSLWFDYSPETEKIISGTDWGDKNFRTYETGNVRYTVEDKQIKLENK